MIQIRITHIGAIGDKSPYFPNYLSEKSGDRFYFSTIVRRELNGVWYKVHVFEDFTMTESLEIRQKLIENGK